MLKFKNKKTRKVRSGKISDYFLFISLSILFSWCTFFNAQAQAINPNLFGQNAWYIDVTNPTVSGPFGFSAVFDARLTDIAASGTKFVRIGGIDPNFFPLYEFNSSTFAITGALRLRHLIDVIRAAGMEPIIEVGFNPLSNYYDGVTCSQVSTLNNVILANQATIAGNLVGYLNNTVYSANPILKWIIANEPDLTISCNPAKGYNYDNTSGTDATIIASYTQAFSIAMKTAFSTITIIGPELTTYGNDTGYKGNTLMNDLVSDPSLYPTKSIMGKIAGGPANNKYFIDVISFHYYPQGLSIRSDVIADPTKCHNGFKSKLSSSGTCPGPITVKGITQMITTNNTGRTSADLQIACTEFNLINNNSSYDESNPSDYANMIKDIGYRSFLGGQWMVEVFSEAMNNGWVEFMNPWSTQEGGCTDGQGYISSCGTSNAKRPTYWHYQMIANNFSDTYLPNISASVTNFKAFAYKNTAASEIGVIVMNQTQQSPRGSDNTTFTFDINFYNTTAGSSTVQFAFAASNNLIGTGGLYSCSITNETTQLLVFNSSTGALKRKEVYSLGDALRSTDIGPEVLVGPLAPIASQLQFDGYFNGIYPDLSISPASSISEGISDSKIFKFVNTATVSGPFTVPLGAIFSLLPVATSCP